jgi:hypothetical protein
VSDIQKINSRIEVSRSCLPEDIRYATYFNIDRDAINTAIFEERAKNMYQNFQNTNGFIIIFSDNIQVKNGSQTYITFRKRRLFWEHCGEDDISMPRGYGRMDPVLKLYTGCRVMLPTNTNVACGQANGTQASVQRVVLKQHNEAQYVYIDNNVPVMAVLASQVHYVELKHCNTRVSPQIFTIRPKSHTFKAKLPKPKILRKNVNDTIEVIQMKAIQIPILINNATTGHKLQGSGVDSLFVHNWSYVTNWPYTMLSRIQELQGLFARKLLSEDISKYQVPESLKKMVHKFIAFSPTLFNQMDYNRISES